MHNFNRELAIIRRPSKEIAAKIIENLAGEIALLLPKQGRSKEEIREVKRLVETARLYKNLGFNNVKGE